MDKIYLTNKIDFDCKPDAVPYNYRISYKVAQLCMIVSNFSTSKSGCSLIKLHITSNALSSDLYFEKIEKIIDRQHIELIVKFDPSVEKGIKYAIADGLLELLKNGTHRLTEKGKSYVNSIYQEPVMLKEKEKLQKIGKRLTNRIVEEIMSTWR